MNMKKISFAVLLLLTPILCVAQTNGVQGQVAQGSNAVSENLFTGASNIFVPLISKKVDGVNAGVSIAYTTSGVTMNQPVSAVGLGWNLNYGGMINRTVKGIPDEITKFGYWHRENYNIDVGPSTIEHLGEAIAQASVSINGVDGQMDVFNASFNGMSLEFMFNGKDEIITIPSNTKIRVERTVNGSVVSTFPKLASMTNNLGFIITDENGNKFYYISGDEVEQTFNSPCGYGGTTTGMLQVKYSMNWMLEKIITHNGKLVKYEYESNPVKVKQLTGIIEEYNPNGNYASATSTPCLLKESFFRSYSEFYNRILERIVFDDVIIKFNYMPVPTQYSTTFIDRVRTLASIDLEERNNFSSWGAGNALHPSKSKKIELNYSYFDATPTAPANTDWVTATGASEADLATRLRLDGISSTIGNTTRTLYNYEYYDVQDIIYPEPADAQPPFFGTPSQDYWGYFTAAPNSNLLDAFAIPQQVIGGVSKGIDRTPNINARTYSLKKIINENKGVTEFFYENNEAIVNSVLTKLDGIRINRTESYTEGMEDNLTKHISRYEYSDGEWLVPSNAYPIINDLFTKTVTFKCAGGPNTNINPPFTVSNVDLYTNYFIGQLGGAQHGYGKVTIKREKEVKSKNFSTNVVSTTADVLDWKEHYFVTLRNLPSALTFNTSSLDPTTYGMNNTNIIFPAPASNTQFTGLTLNSTNYHLPTESEPYTYKQYFPSWVIGTEYKNIQYGLGGLKVMESEQEFDIQVKVYNNDDYLNLYARNDIYGNQGGSNCDATNITMDYYHPFSGRMMLKKNTIKTYLDNTNVKQKEFEYTYDSQTDYLKKTVETFADGTELENIQFYHDNPTWSTEPMMAALNNENERKIVYSEVWKTEPGQTKKLINASGSGFDLYGGKVKRKHSYGLLQDANLTTSPLNGAYTIPTANAGTPITNFDKGGEITQYDDIGNTVEVVGADGKYASSIYDYHQDVLVASVSNAQYNEIAYSSFESNNYVYDNTDPLFQKDKGNWIFPVIHPNIAQTLAATPMGFTGRRSYNLIDAGNAATSITTADNVSLVQGKKYILAFWAKATNQNQNLTITVDNFGATGSQALTMQAYKTISSNFFKLNGWTLYQVEFVANYDKVRLTSTTNSTSCYIDELRLYPADALINTHTYAPLLGKMSDNGPANRPTHYEYDKENRIEISRDFNGHIISKKQLKSQANDQ